MLHYLSQGHCNSVFLPLEANEDKTLGGFLYFVLLSLVLSLRNLFRNLDLSIISLLKVNKSVHIACCTYRHCLHYAIILVRKT